MNVIDGFKLIGVLGLLLASAGIVTKKRRTQDAYYIIGGLCLEAYSIHIGDPVFIILQLIFTLAAAYDYLKIKSEKK